MQKFSRRFYKHTSEKSGESMGKKLIPTYEFRPSHFYADFISGISSVAFGLATLNKLIISFYIFT